ncbi:MAG TPA: sialidase family protein [Polyangiaceae bacterium]|jgi:hypothetical protein|nr:sialidase family protein [Polyangiaceae bacterium]
MHSTKFVGFMRLLKATSSWTQGASLALVASAFSIACSSSTAPSSVHPSPEGGASTPVPTPAELAAEHCAVDRAGFAYTGGATKSASAPAPASAAPVPCISLTGYGSAESSLAVASDGAVFTAPAFTANGNGVVRSRDVGQTWDLSIPMVGGSPVHGRTQPYLYLDPTTNRLFFATSGLSLSGGGGGKMTGGFNLTYSDDEGQTWSYVNAGIGTLDWAKIFAGPPVTSKTTGYPNIVYFSSPSPISTPLYSLTPDHQIVSRSLDGGATWVQAGTFTLKPSDIAGCDPNEWIIYGAGAVAKDGTVYQVGNQCGKLVVEVSKDEGSTFTTKLVTGGDLPPFDTTNIVGIVANPNVLPTDLLTLDPDGNVYVVWVDASGALRLSTSKDQATTWSPSVVVAAPAVNTVRYGSVAAKKAGVVAVAYYGSTDGGVTFDGYVAETTNAFAAAPLFTSVTVDDPADPLYRRGFETGYLGLFTGSDLNEIIEVRYGADGDLWASFVKDMCTSGDASACSWDASAHANSIFQGVVGRMVHGAASAFGTEPVAARPSVEAGVCSETDATAIASCHAEAAQENVCAALGACACDHCACEFAACHADADCDAVRQCAEVHNCRGLDCLTPCGPVVTKAGDLLTTRALAISDCADKAGCPSACSTDAGAGD